MKKSAVISFILLIVTASAIALVYSFSNKSSKMPEIKSSASAGFAVVELFTSEGCSSCPPADAAVAKLLAEKREHVYVLSFHVDYWNRLGWKDPFSKALFSARQRAYATHFSLEGVYTPQVVVNGRTEFVGSNVNKLNAAVETNLRSEAKSDLNISTVKTNDKITVTYAITNTDAVRLNLALVQAEATTEVKSGENGGRKLRHVNIVRAFHAAEVTGKGYLTIEIPAGLTDVPLQLIAYTQSKKNLDVLGAAFKNL